MNVLLIAPDFELQAIQNEVRAISFALRASVLSGVVTRSNVIDSLAEKTWDIVWFATHGNDKGILLSDEQISIADLTAIMRNSGAKLLVLNTCDSRSIGIEIHYELGIDVVTTKTDINDLTAYQTGVLFARSLAKGLTVTEAFNQSKPGQSEHYYLFTSQGNSNVWDMDSKTYDPKRDDTYTIRIMRDLLEIWGGRITDRLARIENQMTGEITSVRNEIHDIRANINSVVVLPMRYKTIFVLAFVALFVPVPLFYSDVRDIIGTSWQFALVVAAVMYVMSALLWSYLWWGSRES